MKLQLRAKGEILSSRRDKIRLYLWDNIVINVVQGLYLELEDQTIFRGLNLPAKDEQKLYLWDTNIIDRFSGSYLPDIFCSLFLSDTDESSSDNHIYNPN